MVQKEPALRFIDFLYFSIFNFTTSLIYLPSCFRYVLLYFLHFLKCAFSVYKFHSAQFELCPTNFKVLYSLHSIQSILTFLEISSFTHRLIRGRLFNFQVFRDFLHLSFSWWLSSVLIPVRSKNTFHKN